MNEIAKRAAEKAGDCKLWSPADALEDTLNEIKGKNVTKIIIWYSEAKDEDGQVLHYSAAGVNRPEHVAMLELAKVMVIEDWRGR